MIKNRSFVNFNTFRKSAELGLAKNDISTYSKSCPGLPFVHISETGKIVYRHYNTKLGTHVLLKAKLRFKPKPPAQSYLNVVVMITNLEL